MNHKKSWCYTSLFLLFSAMLTITSCASSSFPKNEQGVLQAQQATLSKDGMRLRGKILTKAQRVEDRWSYQVEVLEVLNFGDTFARVEPRTSEKVTLYTTSEVKFKRNSEVVFDAMSPIRRDSDQLILNMIVE